MNFDQPPKYDDKWYDEQEQTRILESGTDDEMAMLGKVHSLAKERLDLFRYYARLRRDTQATMEEAVSRREKEKPVASLEELELGTYAEYLEPQVREAVLALRAKGYTTFESGFAGFDSQNISVNDKEFDRYLPSDALLDHLAKLGIKIEVTPASIYLKLERELSLDELKRAWDLVVAEIPDRGEKAHDNETGGAIDFRKKQMELRKGN